MGGVVQQHCRCLHAIQFNSIQFIKALLTEKHTVLWLNHNIIYNNEHLFKGVAIPIRPTGPLVTSG